MAQEIYGGTVRVRSGTVESVEADGSVVWTWSPPSARVISVLAVPGGVDTVVLTEPTATLPKGVPTLFRLRGGGALAWTAEIPTGGDGTYVAAEIQGGRIAANTWDGRRVVIDVDTGRIEAVSFAK
jgi:hypothetical protein